MPVSFTMVDLSPEATAAATKGLKDALEHLRGAAQDRTPYREGDLEGNAFPSQDGLNGTVYYTDVYAARQHEELGWVHPIKGEAKYLEKAAIAEQDTLGQIIATAIDGALS